MSFNLQSNNGPNHFSKDTILVEEHLGFFDSIGLATFLVYGVCLQNHRAFLLDIPQLIKLVSNTTLNTFSGKAFNELICFRAKHHHLICARVLQDCSASGNRVFGKSSTRCKKR